MTDLMDLRFLLRMARDTVAEPQVGGAEILRLAPPRPALWLAFALVIVLSMMLGEVVGLLLPTPEPDAPLTGQPPVVMGLLQGALLFIGVYMIAHLGRYFGGSGDFDGALALMTWLQFIFLLVQLIQLAAIIIAPPLVAIISLAAVALFFWLLVNFIAVLHGFTSLGRVFFATLGCFLGAVFALSLVLSLLGLGFEMPMEQEF